MAHDHDHDDHDHVHLDPAHWAAWMERLEIEGRLVLPVTTAAAEAVLAHRGPAARPVRRVLDLGSGPGVGTLELARLFDRAEVVAVDSSPEMLARVAERAAGAGRADRVRTHPADLADGLAGVQPADVVWASMSLHHVGDEVAALRAMRSVLVPDGILALAESGEPVRVLPEQLDVGRPGLGERLEAARATWFAAMRAGLPGSVPSGRLVDMVEAAGFEVLEAALRTVRLDPPLSPDAHRFALDHLRGSAERLAGHLDDDDRAALAVLGDPDDPRGAAARADLRVVASRQVVIARPASTS